MIPAQVHHFPHPQPMPVREKNHRIIPDSMPPHTAGGFAQRLHFARREILTGTHVRVCVRPGEGKLRVLSQSSIFGVKSKNRVSGIQGVTDSQTLEKTTLRQNLSRKDSVGQIIKARVTVVTRVALAGGFRVITAALNDAFRLTRGADDTVWPASFAYRLITLHIIDQILDVDLQR